MFLASLIRRRCLKSVVLCCSIVIVLIYFCWTNKRIEKTMKLKFSIEHLWNSDPITKHRPVEIILSSNEKRDQLLIEIDAPFFNDPPPENSSSIGPRAELWNYEVVELFFLSSSTNHYLELEFSPHGYYLVLLLTDRRKVLKQLLPIEFFHVDRPSSDRWIGRASIPMRLFPGRIDRFNAYAIHGLDRDRTYEALYPATKTSKEPDFHRLEFFKTLQIDSLIDVSLDDGEDWTNH